jgi:hypothetical protein
MKTTAIKGYGLSAREGEWAGGGGLDGGESFPSIVQEKETYGHSYYMNAYIHVHKI